MCAQTTRMARRTPRAPCTRRWPTPSSCPPLTASMGHCSPTGRPPRARRTPCRFLSLSLSLALSFTPLVSSSCLLSCLSRFLHVRVLVCCRGPRVLVASSRWQFPRYFGLFERCSCSVPCCYPSRSLSFSLLFFLCKHTPTHLFCFRSHFASAVFIRVFLSP